MEKNQIHVFHGAQISPDLVISFDNRVEAFLCAICSIRVQFRFAFMGFPHTQKPRQSEQQTATRPAGSSASKAPRPVLQAQ